MAKISCAIIGSGNIGTDLMIKIMRNVATSRNGRDGRHRPEVRRPGARRAPGRADHARGHRRPAQAARIQGHRASSSTPPRPARTSRTTRSCSSDGKQVIDLTPAAIGPYAIPAVNGDAHLDAPNVNMVTCGGQATIPIVARRAPRGRRCIYGEIVASISSQVRRPRHPRQHRRVHRDHLARPSRWSAAPTQGKAIIILNPAEPPLIMRDTVFTPVARRGSRTPSQQSIDDMVADVQSYVPGYRLKQKVQFERIGANAPVHIPGVGRCSRPEDHDLPRSRRRGALPARLCRQSRHHDLGRAAHRRADRAAKQAA